MSATSSPREARRSGCATCARPARERCASAGGRNRSRAVELDDADKPPILRAYLEAWAWEVGKFFEGLKADSPDADVAAAASGFPAFRVG